MDKKDQGGPCHRDFQIQNKGELRASESESTLTFFCNKYQIGRPSNLDLHFFVYLCIESMPKVNLKNQVTRFFELIFITN